MDESKNSSKENDKIKKAAHVVQGDNKSVRVVSNQIYKNKSAKCIKETASPSPNGNSTKKNKQTYTCTEPTGEAESIKVNMVNCITGVKDPPSSIEDQRSLCKTRTFSHLVTATEIQKLASEQEVTEVSSAQNMENGIKESTQAILVKSSSETPPKTDKSNAGNDSPVGSTEIDYEQSAGHSNSDDREKKNSRSDENDRVTTELENGSMVDDNLSPEEQKLGLKQAEERLERDYIFRLEKPSPDFPNYHYKCKLCRVHIENVQGAHKHIKEKRHKKNITEKQEENELRCLPPPSPSQVAALRSALLEAAKEHGISDEDFNIRQGIVIEMENNIRLNLPDCSLRLYGSCITRFAFKTSDINIDVKIPPRMTQPDVLIKVLEILKNCDLYSEVESDFHAEVPVVFCKDIKSGLMCKVSAGNEVACLTTNLLAALGKLEPALIPLVLAFRYWARLCHIDCPSEGGIPSYSFALMVMFFLQQRKPPILPAYLGTWMEGFDSKKIDDHQLKEIEDGCFLTWEYKWANNSETINSNSEGRTSAETQKVASKKTFRSENDSNAMKAKNGRSPLVFDKTHEVSLGQLWLELLKFYTLEFALEEYVISVRVQAPLTREYKNWPKRRIAIEDPFALSRNVARSLNSQMVFEYILERFRTAYKYFACPQRKVTNKAKLGTIKKERSDKKDKEEKVPCTNSYLLSSENVNEKITAIEPNVRISDPVKCNAIGSIPTRCLPKNGTDLLQNNANSIDFGSDAVKCRTVSLTANGHCISQESSLNEQDEEPSECKDEPTSINCITQNSLSQETDHARVCTNNLSACPSMNACSAMVL